MTDFDDFDDDETVVEAQVAHLAGDLFDDDETVVAPASTQLPDTGEVDVMELIEALGATGIEGPGAVTGDPRTGPAATSSLVAPDDGVPLATGFLSPAASGGPGKRVGEAMPLPPTQSAVDPTEDAPTHADRADRRSVDEEPSRSLEVLRREAPAAPAWNPPDRPTSHHASPYEGPERVRWPSRLRFAAFVVALAVICGLVAFVLWTRFTGTQELVLGGSGSTADLYQTGG